MYKYVLKFPIGSALIFIRRLLFFCFLFCGKNANFDRTRRRSRRTIKCTHKRLAGGSFHKNRINIMTFMLRHRFGNIFLFRTTPKPPPSYIACLRFIVFAYARTLDTDRGLTQWQNRQSPRADNNVVALMKTKVLRKD